MDLSKLEEELNRLINLMAQMDPTTEKYDKLQKHYNGLHQIYLKESQKRNAQQANESKNELEERKFEHSKERFEFEKDKFEAEQKLNEKKFDHQINDDLRKDLNETRRLEIEEQRVRNEECEAKERSQYTKKQAIFKLLEVGVQTTLSGVFMFGGIVLTGKMEESAILSSKAFSFISKPKL